MKEAKGKRLKQKGKSGKAKAERLKQKGESKKAKG